jgi:hypothetical protein
MKKVGGFFSSFCMLSSFPLDTNFLMQSRSREQSHRRFMMMGVFLFAVAQSAIGEVMVTPQQTLVSLSEYQTRMPTRYWLPPVPLSGKTLITPNTMNQSQAVPTVTLEPASEMSDPRLIDSRSAETGSTPDPQSDLTFTHGTAEPGDVPVVSHPHHVNITQSSRGQAAVTGNETLATSTTKAPGQPAMSTVQQGSKPAVVASKATTTKKPNQPDSNKLPAEGKSSAHQVSTALTAVILSIPFFVFTM